MLEKPKRWVGWRVRNLAEKLGIDLRKVPDLELQINKLRLIRDNHAMGLRMSEELMRKHPKHPSPHLECARFLVMLNDPRQFEQLDRYGEVRRDWLAQTGLAELDMEFIWVGMVVGSLGNHFAIEGLLKANQLGLRCARKPFLLLPRNVQLRNPALFEYFEPHLNVVRDEESVQALKRLGSLLTLPLGLTLPMNDGCPLMDLAANRIEMEREKLGLKSTLFQLNDRHREMGGQALKKLGLPDDAWYVTLHMREPGYRGETPENTTEHWRNVNPLSYLKACEAVTNAGGWVLRMGDPSMTPLPSIPQVIDYAHHEIRCDWMDVFLGATCQFLIGTGSGYFHIPALFGVPCIETNFPGFISYLDLKKHDIYLPRLLRNTRSESLLTFKKYMSPPISMFKSTKSIQDAGLDWVENTPEELEAATKEMLARSGKGSSSTIPDDGLQQRFKAVAETCGLKYDGRSVKAFAPMSQQFIEQHRDLL